MSIEAEGKFVTSHNEIMRSQAVVPPPPRRANPSTLGLFSFATTTLLLSFINAGTRGLKGANIVVGMMFWVGGIAQFTAGLFEWHAANSFGFTVFCTYGAFWLSLGTMFWPSSGILAAYAETKNVDDALGLFMMCWFVITTIFTIGTLRHSVAHLVTFVVLDTAFLMLGCGHLFRVDACIKAAGYFGLTSAFGAYYIGTAVLYAEDKMPFRIPLGAFH